MKTTKNRGRIRLYQFLTNGFLEISDTGMAYDLNECWHIGIVSFLVGAIQFTLTTIQFTNTDWTRALYYPVLLMVANGILVISGNLIIHRVPEWLRTYAYGNHWVFAKGLVWIFIMGLVVMTGIREVSMAHSHLPILSDTALQAKGLFRDGFEKEMYHFMRSASNYYWVHVAFFVVSGILAACFPSKKYFGQPDSNELERYA